MDNILADTECSYNYIGLGMDKHVEGKRLHPLLKWAGGKEQELKYIIPNLPEKFVDYYEPFVGGGSVYTAIQADNYYINDKSEELICLYNSITNEDRPFFFKALDEIIHNWDLLTIIIIKNATFFIQTYKKYSQGRIDDTKLKDILFEFVLTHSDQFNGMFSAMFNYNIENFVREINNNLVRKIKRMKQLERIKDLLPDKDIVDNIETALKSAFYMHFRHIYNNTQKYKITQPFKSAIFLFIRNFAYSGMFRYNSKGDFNVPYGGIGYNRKNILKKVDYLRSKELASLLHNTTIENLDFEEFLTKYHPTKDDFIFLDPPYDSEFNTYAKNEFTKTDQKRLADYLLRKCEAKWMMIIKNTDFIFDLYANKGLVIKSFDKKYLVSFMNRNEKNAKHLIITNY